MEDNGMGVIGRLGVRGKVAIAFSALFVMVAAVGVLNAAQIRAVSRAAVEIREEWLPAIEALADLKLMFTRARLVSARTIATSDPAERTLVEARHQKFLTWVDEASKHYERVIKNAEEQALYERFRNAWQEYRRFETPLLAAPHGDRAAINGFNFGAQERYATTLATLDDLTALNNRRVAAGVAAGEATYRRALWLTGLTTLLAAAIALGAAAWVNRSVVAKVIRLAKAMRRLARRDYAFALPDVGSDEIGDMVRAVEECRQGLRQADVLAAEQQAAERARIEAEAARGLAEAELRSVRERERADRELSVQHARFSAALGNMSQGLCMVDGAGQVVVANRRFLELFGFSQAPTQGQPFADWLEGLALNGGISRADVEDLRRSARRFSEQKAVETFVWELADGRAMSVSQQPMGDGSWLATYEDITERRRAEAQVKHMAHHDALTGLPNRVLFRQRLDEALARGRRGETFAVLCLDLDHFKAVNDSLGHPVGDGLLEAVTARLQQHVRDVDTVARLGGDEFAVIQVGVDQPLSATVLAKRLVETLSAPYEIKGHQVVVGASIGIAIGHDDGADADTLLRNGDMALYRAKDSGRGTYCFFEPGMDARMQARRVLELDLRRALADQEFELFYQPIMDLGTCAISGFEALIRWQHPERGLVAPGDFIPLAEEIGLIVPLGQWVLNQACRDAAGWPAPLKVAVNLSPVQFSNCGPVQAIAAALQKSGLDPSRLELEITETVMLEDTETTLRVLRDIKALGVGIALDDFGTGYSSLSYLRKFPFDRVKIDKSFIEDLGQPNGSGAIIQAVTTLCGILGMATTAEGIETEEQLRELQFSSCTNVQGYLFSKPRPNREIAGLYRRLSRQPRLVAEQATA